MEPRQKQFSLWFVVAAMLLMLGIQHFLFAPQAANLSYSDFKGLLRAGKVSDLTLTEHAIGGRLRKDGLEGMLPKEKMEELQKSGQGEYRFTTVRVDDPGLVKDLE